MTNTIAVSAPRRFGRAAMWLGVGLIVPLLAGCEGGSFLSGALGNGTTAATNVVAPVAQAQTKVAFLPVIGAPGDVASKMSLSLMAASERQNLSLAKASGEAVDYTVRGYVVAAPDKGGTKVSYIWDVADKSGQRAHRISGEEIVKGKKGKDPWSVVDQAIIDGIANKTVAQLQAFVPKQAGAGPMVAAADSKMLPADGKASIVKSETKGLMAQSAGTLVPNSEPVNLPAGDGQPMAAKSGNSAALPPGAVAAMVPSVEGAPGDGQQSLAKALQRQLAANGVRLADAGGAGSYIVKGKVLLGSPADGKQSIKIEWQVLDPSGKRVGTVSQNNVIPQGSLDGAWGKTADAAAAAAAQGIIKLLPQQKSG